MLNETPGPFETERIDRNLIQGKSQMAGLIRAHEWRPTPLGRVEEWTEGLLSSVNLMLACAFPSLVFWGEELVQLYNDAFISPFSRSVIHQV